ncbi:nicotinate phosphoribosyltransferase [Candidatus Thorarchaeota archaeon]|nr:MAG: nicotinate phosphoribosyltransferase [Candidatus Thorarchaeota archaeon]
MKEYEMRRRWRIATEEEILRGKTTDVYFDRTVEVLRATDVNPRVYAEVTVSEMPQNLPWGIAAGYDDVLQLFKGTKVDIYGLKEGTLFHPRNPSGVRTPVLQIDGNYANFAQLETPLLGFLCYTSGMASKTAHLRRAAGDKTILSFGARRTHPAVTPTVEYAAYIGGCDGVSCVLGADLIGIEAQGTMPHSLIISFQDHLKAWKAFSKYLDEDVARIALTDTYLDEVFESIMASSEMPGITGVRLDTPSSRRGDFKELIQEVRWELDVRGYEDVKIFVSGGIDIEELENLKDAPVSGYGIGGAISNAPAVDFAMDIVSIMDKDSWKPCAKRGKFSGRKTVWKCKKCIATDVTPWEASAPKCHSCGTKMEKATMKLLDSEEGEILQDPVPPSETRNYVIDQLSIIGEQ